MIENFGTLKRLLMQGIRFLPSPLLRFCYTEKRMQSLIMMGVAPRGGQVIFDFGTPEYTEVRLRICNFSLFPVIVDRLKVEIWGIENSLRTEI